MKTNLFDLIKKFHPSILKLSLCDTNIKVSKNIFKTLNNVKGKISEFETLRSSIAQSKSKKDLNGKPISEKGSYVYENDEVKKHVIDTINSLLYEDMEVEVFPICFDDLNDIKISANDIENLQFFIINN